jgi:WD40 repeat protein
LFTLSGHTQGLTGVAWSPDGTRLATASYDKTLRIYITDRERLIRVAQARVARRLTPAECKRYLDPEHCEPQSLTLSAR